MELRWLERADKVHARLDCGTGGDDGRIDGLGIPQAVDYAGVVQW